MLLLYYVCTYVSFLFFNENSKRGCEECLKTISMQVALQFGPGLPILLLGSNP